tara:strand:+ start:85 stop:1314 length:1230 start_codon:yes stop_codon:yes gene_type:complete
MSITPGGLSAIVDNPSLSPSTQQITPVRVKFVSLNGKDYPLTWEKYGKYAGVGGILYEDLDKPGTENLETLAFAVPLHSNIKALPVVNEIVYIISLPNPSVQSNINGGYCDYYFNSISLWNNVHHNALPNSLANKDSNSQNYENTEAGFQQQSAEQESPNFGKTFKEKPEGEEIRNLQPFEGDVLLEGRWGNTIRFGSTVNNSTPSNLWSNSGNDGEPIVIIKNGQTKTEDDKWIPQVENINTDKSSIYLTSNQQIPIEGISIDYNSYDTPPTNPNEYIEEQVLINSGRLYFNAKNDSILLSANTSINLNTQDTVNIDSKNKFVVDTKEIYLGSKDATEPVILGDKFLDDFEKLLQEMISLCSALTTVGTPIPFTPNIPVIQTATKVNLQSQSMLSSISFYKSKTSKTL